MVAERQQIASLQKPPVGWRFHPELHERRRGGANGNQHNPTDPLSARYTGQALTTGPRADAEPTADLPTLRPGFDPEPRECSRCGSRFLNREPAIGEHSRGLISCGRCGRQLCWLGPDITTASRARTVMSTSTLTSSPPARPSGSVRAMATTTQHQDDWRRPSCGDGCRRERVIVLGQSSVRVGAEWREYHDLDQHDRHQAGLMLALAVSISRRPGAPGPIVRTGPLVIDLDAQRVLVGGAERHCTPVEWAILGHLARRLDRLCPAVDVAVAVWPDAVRRDRTAPTTLANRRDSLHLVRVQLSRLRAKLGAARHLIENRPGVGYLLRSEAPTGGAS